MLNRHHNNLYNHVVNLVSCDKYDEKLKEMVRIPYKILDPLAAAFSCCCQLFDKPAADDDKRIGLAG